MSETKREHDQPIPGPAPVNPVHLTEPDYERPLSPALAAARFFADLIRTPAHWVRENIVEPNKGPKYYWYHRRYNRALPVDECYLDDYACIHEANIEYRRNHQVDRATLELLKIRRDNCLLWWAQTKSTFHIDEACSELKEIYHREEDNFHIKYGDIHYGLSVIHAYNKQKHRMIVERRRAIAAKEREKEMEQLTSVSA